MKYKKLGIVPLIALLMVLAWHAFAASLSGSLSTDNTGGTPLQVKKGDSVTWTYTVDTAEQFIGEFKFQESSNGGLTWSDTFTIETTVAAPLTEGSTSGTYENDNFLLPKLVRFYLRNIDDANTSDEIQYSITDVANIYKDARIVDGVVKTDDNVTLMRFYEDGVQIPTWSATGASSLTGGLTKEGVVRYFNAGGKAGSTSGWTTSTANIGVIGNLPADKTGSTFLVPISGLEVGDVITGIHMIGQIEAGGGTGSVQADLRRLTAVASDVTDASVQTLSVSTSSDLALTSANASTLSTPETVSGLETFYVLLTATTNSNCDIALQAIALTITKTY